MKWLLERIEKSSNPVIFGVEDERRHPSDFAKLVKNGTLQRISNPESVHCELCFEAHESQLRAEDEELFYVCEYGGGKKVLSSDEIKVYEFDVNIFLKTLAKDLDIEIQSSGVSDEGAYSAETFYRVGVGHVGNTDVEIYYLRTLKEWEPSSYFSDLGSESKILITNLEKPKMTHGKEGTLYCVLSDLVAGQSERRVFSKTKFDKYLQGTRRVYFDEHGGLLYLDNNIVYVAGKGSAEYYFLKFLWKKWSTQQEYADIARFVQSSRKKRKTADTAAKICQKIKSSIKKQYPDIDAIISNPAPSYYIMSDPME